MLTVRELNTLAEWLIKENKRLERALSTPPAHEAVSDKERLDAWEKWFDEVYKDDGKFYLASEMVVHTDEPFESQNGPDYEFRQAIDQAISNERSKTL